MADKERIDWLEAKASDGSCPGLINDDNGHWALSFEGTQNCPVGDGVEDILTYFFVDAKDWKDSVRDAIDHFM